VRSLFVGRACRRPTMDPSTSDDVMRVDYAVHKLLRKLALRREHARIRRLGHAMLQALEHKQMSCSSADTVFLPSDPALSHQLAQASLPELGTKAATQLAITLHAHLCEVASASGQAEELGYHARAGLAHARRMHGDLNGDVGVRWCEVWFGHAALVAVTMSAATQGGAAAGRAIASSRREVLRQLCDYCRCRSSTSQPTDYVPPLALLQFVLGVASLSLSRGHQESRLETLRALCVVLRCVLADVQTQQLPSAPHQRGDRPELATGASTASLPEDAAELLAHLHHLLPQLVSRPVLALKRLPGWVEEEDDDEEEDACLLTSILNQKEAPTKRAKLECRDGYRIRRKAVLDSASLWEMALIRCGGVAAMLTMAAGNPRASADALRISQVCVDVDTMPGGLFTSELLPSSFLANGIAPPSLEKRHVTAWALQVQALCLMQCALSSGASSVANAGTLLRRAAHAASAALAQCTPTCPSPDNLIASHGRGTADGAHSRHSCAALLLFLGQTADAAAALLHGSPRGTIVTASASEHHAMVAAVVHACKGERTASLEALQHALTLSSADGAAAALPLYNLLAHYDGIAADTRSTIQWEAARRIATFLLQADFDAVHNTCASGVCQEGVAESTVRGLAGTSASGSDSVVVCVRPQSNRTKPILRGHNTRSILSPLGASYLHARAQLLCGEWEPCAASLEQLLKQAHALRPTLDALGADELSLLRQLGFAMLQSGRHFEWLQLAEARGVQRDPRIADLVADALLCEFEPLAALEALENGNGKAQRNLVRTASGQGTPAATPLGTTAKVAEQLRAELRMWNNRACLLTCSERFAEAEEALLQCLRLAPYEKAPAYNLALLRWQVGALDAAAEGWLRFRRWSLEASPEVYEQFAAACQPVCLPPQPSCHVTGHVDPESIAELDRTMLRHWAARRSRVAMEAHWGRAGAPSW